MPDISLLAGSQKVETAGDATADSGLTSITAGNSNAKGSYAQVIASTARDANWIGISVFLSYAAPVEILIDIAIGSATEQVIVENLHISYRNLGSYYALFPLHIPAGSRIAARAQNSAPAGSIAAEVGCYLFAGRPGASAPFGSKVSAYGADTSDSGGVSVDPGASANTKGSYSELTSSTTEKIDWLYIEFGGQSNSVRTDATWLVDVAIGSSGSEEIILSNLFVSNPAAWDNFTPEMLGPFPVYIPAGTRIAVRAQCTITDSTDRTFDAIVYGV